MLKPRTKKKKSGHQSQFVPPEVSERESRKLTNVPPPVKSKNITSLPPKTMPEKTQDNTPAVEEENNTPNSLQGLSPEYRLLCAQTAKTIIIQSEICSNGVVSSRDYIAGVVHYLLEKGRLEDIEENVSLSSRERFKPSAEHIVFVARKNVDKMLSNLDYDTSVLDNGTIENIYKDVITSYLEHKMGEKHLILFAEKELKNQILRKCIKKYSTKMNVDPLDYYNEHYKPVFEILKVGARSTLRDVDANLNSQLGKKKQLRCIG